ncbi:DUF5110 domain-containing protein [Acidipila sp. EB88]|uniref:DUF5110 domain-containing protein n=1 Tax=Acidipila sp. EB88 TaxID=2305226 RepID=UPI001F2D5B62|nr:DUF5110 domain-containing protein [Acidipila sp. EB88]
MSPLVQSTEERPQGPLTLRVYPASDPAAPCTGDVYADDGKSFAFRHDQYARIHFTCARTPGGGIAFTVAPQQGAFTPWWQQYRIQLFGFKPAGTQAEVNGKPVAIDTSGDIATVIVAAERAGLKLTIR